MSFAVNAFHAYHPLSMTVKSIPNRTQHKVTITFVVDTEPSQWLLIRYRAESESIAIGVALYVPGLNALYLKFRDDMSFVGPDSHEILADAGEMFKNMSIEMGAKPTFEWMADSLSNAVFVEGPKTLSVSQPDQTIEELYNLHCTSLQE